jgi:hypothetical protein
MGITGLGKKKLKKYLATLPSKRMIHCPTPQQPDSLLRPLSAEGQPQGR